MSILNQLNLGNLESEDEIQEKWKLTGLLHGLECELSLPIANKMEEMAKLVLSIEIIDDKEYETVIFPIIRRVCHQIYSDASPYSFKVMGGDFKVKLINELDVTFIWDRLNKFYPILNGYFKDFYGDDCPVDSQAETCASLAEDLGRLYLSIKRNELK